ncbi:DUF6278 family protein [Streptomyces sp. NPDC059506]|uniref:DUF6278 family protein n=1 Tax=unclassified Streptomyces TaxID=2593676 RepID=UPI000CBC738A|nr:DUF6278 family protein [Streptomyces sp. SCUT-3]PLW73835.1 hypothetical protein C0036_05130 [Streptomyces sp. DJ]QMV21278.1 hypothetical protein GQS52_05275 [Streptomyces sp. SCUT-3]
MGIPFLDRWRRRHGPVRGVAVMAVPGGGSPRDGADGGRDGGPEGASEAAVVIAELLSECELLRAQAREADVELDDGVESLAALDQLVPRWRDDEERRSWLGNDAGLYLGTVIVRHVAGASWQVWPGGRPVVRLPDGRELDVVAVGHSWADEGAPELAQAYAETVAEAED